MVFSTSNSVFFLLKEEGISFEDFNKTNPINELIAHDWVNEDWDPRRYQTGGAMFISQPLITLDWDGDDKKELEEDVIWYLEQDAEWHPSHLWEVQETPHGFHAVLLTDCEVPQSLLKEWGSSMNVDDLYLEMRKEDLFDWRISPKHKDCFVCRPIYRIGTGTATDKVEELLSLYYRAVKYCCRNIEVLKDTWEEVLVDDFYWDIPCYEYEKWGTISTNPFTNERWLSVRIYENRDKWEESWWTKVNIKI